MEISQLGFAEQEHDGVGGRQVPVGDDVGAPVPGDHSVFGVSLQDQIIDVHDPLKWQVVHEKGQESLENHAHARHDQDRGQETTLIIEKVSDLHHGVHPHVGDVGLDPEGVQVVHLIL